jgi:hypothetical protein
MDTPARGSRVRCVNSVRAPNRQVCRADCGAASQSQRRAHGDAFASGGEPSHSFHSFSTGNHAAQLRSAPHPRAPGPTVSGGSAAEEVDQLASLSIGQTAERLRVSDPTSGEDAAGSDRADLRHRQEDIAQPRCPHTGGWVGEDLHQLDLSRRELLLQLRPRRPYLVRLLQRTQTLFARSARNARTRAAL